MTEHEWVIEALRFYRSLEFFVEHAHLSDAELAEQLIAQRSKAGWKSYVAELQETGTNVMRGVDKFGFPRPETFAEMELISRDVSRVWWKEGEANIYSGAEVYTKFLNECSVISRGAFNLVELETREEWEDKILEAVSFELGEDRWRIFPNNMYGWIDFQILGQINEIIQDSGYQFKETYTGDEAFIVVLTEAEQRRFEAERDWDFWK